MWFVTRNKKWPHLFILSKFLVHDKCNKTHNKPCRVTNWIFIAETLCFAVIVSASVQKILLYRNLSTLKFTNSYSSETDFVARASWKSKTKTAAINSSKNRNCTKFMTNWIVSWNKLDLTTRLEFFILSRKLRWKCRGMFLAI